MFFIKIINKNKYICYVKDPSVLFIENYNSSFGKYQLLNY